MSEPVGPNPDEARKAAAALVDPDDPVAAEVVAKYSAGQKLNQREYGIIGSLKAKAKRLVGLGDSPGEPNSSGPRDTGPVGTVGTAQAPDSSLPAVPPNPGLCQRVTGAVLTRLEAIARRKLGRAAREADPKAEAKTLARVDRAASLSPDDKALMIELSADVARELGMDPKRYCLAVFFGTLGMWGADIWLAIDELKQEAKQRQGATPELSPAAALLREAQRFPSPAPPLGAPPTVTGPEPPKVT